MVFGAFSKMINGLPAEAVIKALEAECKMLENDIEHQRIEEKEEAFSILSFRYFVRMAREGNVARCSRSLPHGHVEFYKATITRLVEAGELPGPALEQFDYAFAL